MITFDPHTLTADLKAEAEALRASGDAPATVVQIEQGNLTVKAAAGVSDLETDRPASADQTFEIGSQTKMMTAVVILQLVEEGRIDLDARAADYLPAETIAGLANADLATVRQLLNMTSGIPNYTDATDEGGLPLFAKALLENPDQVFGPQQALEIARTMPATGAPGELDYYSNTNYALLGEMIEGLTGQPFITALQQRVFDPVGMTNSVRQLNPDDPRLSSYTLNPLSGEPVDVTRAQWEMHGEAGVAANTDDMIAFVRALLVDKTLLGTNALAEMTEYLNSDSGPGFKSFFGLGLVKITLDNGDSFVGFTGGTLATESSTYLSMDTGAVISLAGTGDAINSASGGLAILTALDQLAAWQPVVDDGSPLLLASGAAADLRLAQEGAGLGFTVDGASLTLDRHIAGLSTGTVQFADGSVLVVGDNTADRMADRGANDIDILRDFSSASTHNNQLIGLGGNDRLTAGNGADRVSGGAGNDLIRGRDSDDTLAGGVGNDRLFGGAGADRLNGGDGTDILVGGGGGDILRGGAGADRFVFQAGEDPTDRMPDRIADFEHGQDRISLRMADGDDMTWLGTDCFTGAAGETRFETTQSGLRVQVDVDGNQCADIIILLRGTSTLTEADFLI